MTGTRRRRAAVVALVLATLACAGPPAPEPRQFRLVAEPGPAPAAADRRWPGTLVVERPRAGALLAERPFLWRPSPESPELVQQAYTLWSDAPADLVQRALDDALERAAVADDVVVDGLGVDGAWRLESRLGRLERIGGGRPQVEVEIDYALVRVADRVAVVHGRHRGVRDARSERVEDAVAAFGAALGGVLDAIVADLAAAAPPAAAR